MSLNTVDKEVLEYQAPGESLMVQGARVPVVPSGAPLAPPNSIMDLLQLAVVHGLPAEQMKELVALRDHVEDRNARREFFNAMAAFQSECPPIYKSATNKQTGDEGTQKKFTYATYEDIVAAIQPVLMKHGLSYTFDTDTSNPSTLTTIIIVRHLGGHSQESRITFPTPTKLGMSDQQRVVGAFSFGRRMCLIAGFGLTGTDEAPEKDKGDTVKITDAQVVELTELLTVKAVGRNEEKLWAKFLGVYGIESLQDMPASKFAQAHAQLSGMKTNEAAS